MYLNQMIHTFAHPIFDPKITISTVPILQTCAVAIRSGTELPGKE